MKDQKGITMLSLVITIVVLSLVVSMLALFSSLFTSNVNIITDSTKYIGEFNKFNMYFIKDVKNNKSIYSLTDTGDELVFMDGTVYTYKSEPDNGIYRNKVKICNNVTSCRFIKEEKEEDGVKKQIVNAIIIINGTKIFNTNNKYVLKYW